MEQMTHSAVVSSNCQNCFDKLPPPRTLHTSSLLDSHPIQPKVVTKVSFISVVRKGQTTIKSLFILHFVLFCELQMIRLSYIR